MTLRVGLIGLLLACGRSAPPPVPVQPPVVMATLESVSEDGSATVLLTSGSAWVLDRAECAIWQEGVMVDTVQTRPELSLPPRQPVRLNLTFEELEPGPVQLTGSLHLAGLLGAQELVLVELSGVAIQEGTP